MPVPVATKVHPPETSVGGDDYPPLWDRVLLQEPVQTFRHSGWAHDRQRVWDALCFFTASPRRLDRFATCGLTPHVYRSLDPPYRYKVAGDSCRDRFCLPCARSRGNVIAGNILNKLDGQSCRFLTLTLRSTDESLADLLKLLHRSFRLLRGTDTWNRAVRGGVAFIEAKWNDYPGRWHVHLHALLQGAWVNKPDLEAHWRRITAGSYVCDLRHCPESTKVTRYVVKYCAKPYDHSVVVHHDRLIEAIGAFRGRRLFTTFGDWRGLPLLHRDDESRWTNIGLLSDLLAAARTGAELPIAILTELNPEATVDALAEHAPRAPPTFQDLPPPPTEGKQLRLIPSW